MSKEQIEKWRKSEAGHRLEKIKSTRYDLKVKLIKGNLLPEDYPYTKVHEELMDLLKANQFDIIKKYYSDNRVIPPRKQRPKRSEGDIRREYERKKRRAREATFLRKIGNLQSAGLLPEDMKGELTQQHQEIVDKVKNGTTISALIEEYINDANVATKQKIILQRLKVRTKHPRYLKTGHYLDLKPEDIIINEYCPFLGVKIDYRTSHSKSIREDGCSIDRIRNERSYVSGNVWVISRLANTIKNDSTLEELKTFCINIIKRYETN